MIETLRDALRAHPHAALARETMVVSTRPRAHLEPVLRGLLALPFQQQLAFGAECVARVLATGGCDLAVLRGVRGLAAQAELRTTSCHAYPEPDPSALGEGLGAAVDALWSAAFRGVVRDLARDLDARDDVACQVLAAADRAAQAMADVTAEHDWQAARLAAALRGEVPPPALDYDPRETFRVGERLRHPRFGDGRVVEVRAGQVVVELAGERKTLAHAR